MDDFRKGSISPVDEGQIESHTNIDIESPQGTVGLFQTIATGLRNKPAYLFFFGIVALFALTGIIGATQKNLWVTLIGFCGLAISVLGSIIVIKLVETSSRPSQGFILSEPVQKEQFCIRGFNSFDDASNENTLLKESFFNALNSLKNESINNIEDLYPIYWSKDQSMARKWTKTKIKNAEKEILIISFSLISYLTDIEPEILKFLGRRGKLRVLLLDPCSLGFQVKTAAEALFYSDNDDFESWKYHVMKNRKDFKIDIDGAISKFETWSSNHRNNVMYQTYCDVPFINGCLIDRKSMIISSYFIDPTIRGYGNPSLIVEDVNSDVNFRILSNIFYYWFKTQFFAADHYQR